MTREPPRYVCALLAVSLLSGCAAHQWRTAGGVVAGIGGLGAAAGVCIATGLYPGQETSSTSRVPFPNPNPTQEAPRAAPEAGGIVIMIGLSLAAIGGAIYGLAEPSSAPPAPRAADDPAPAAQSCSYDCRGDVACEGFNAFQCPTRFGCELSDGRCLGVVRCESFESELGCSAHRCAWTHTCQ